MLKFCLPILFIFQSLVAYSSSSDPSVCHRRFKSVLLEENQVLILKSEVELRSYPRLKRFVDLMLVGPASIVAIPVASVMALLVKLDSPKEPVFFKQSRIGYRGKKFKILKMRTMTDSHGEKRITRIGRFLRKYHLDEIPQIFNILKGDMTFIGPRPLTEEVNQEDLQKFDGLEVRFFVRPGLTGLAQVKCHYQNTDEEAESRVRLDVEYVRNQSAFLDLKIMCETLWVLPQGRAL